MEREGTMLPNGWAWATIGEIAQPIEKVDPANEPDKQFTYLDISSIDNATNMIRTPKTYRGADAPSRARQLVRAHDVLFSTVRTYLKNIAQVPEAYDGQIASTGFSVLRGEEGISSKYLFYFSLTTDFLSALADLQRGTSYPAVRDGDVRAQSIPLAPTVEQHRIVAEIEKQFTRLDAGVAALKRAQANLKRYRAAVLKAACEGRLVPQDPHDEPASKLLERILAERRNVVTKRKGAVTAPLKPPDTDGLPALPEGWCWATFEQIISNFRSGSTAVPHDEVADFPILRSSSVRPLQINYADVRYLNEEDSRDAANFLQAGNLLFTRLSGSLDYVGNCALVRSPEAMKIQYPDRIFCATLVDDRLGEFVEAWFSTPLARKQTMAMAKSTAGHQRISMDAIKRRKFPLPPLVEQRRIVAEVERRLSVVQEVETVIAANLARAERLRQSVLKQAFEGKLARSAQDPNDEPASALLEHIRAQRTGTASADAASPVRHSRRKSKA